MVKLTNEMKQDFVKAHNDARASVSPTAADMVPLEWDKKVEKISKKFVRSVMPRKQCQKEFEPYRLLKYILTKNNIIVNNGIVALSQPRLFASRLYMHFTIKCTYRLHCSLIGYIEI